MIDKTRINAAYGNFKKLPVEIADMYRDIFETRSKTHKNILMDLIVVTGIFVPALTIIYTADFLWEFGSSISF